MQSNPDAPHDANLPGYDDPAVRILVDRYGPLVPHAGVAELLHRSPASLRESLSRHSRMPEYQQLRAARVLVGRRTLYDVRVVASIMTGGRP